MDGFWVFERAAFAIMAGIVSGMCIGIVLYEGHVGPLWLRLLAAGIASYHVVRLTWRGR